MGGVLSQIDRLLGAQFVRIIAKAELDPLLASGVLFHNLHEHGVSAAITLDLKSIIDGRDEDHVLVGLPSPRGRKPTVLTQAQQSTLTATVVAELDKRYGIASWEKKLSIAVGVFSGLSVGREEFRGLEKSMLNELLARGEIEHSPTFRFWGFRRVPIAQSIYRTLVPYMPGVSGKPETAKKVVEASGLQPAQTGQQSGLDEGGEKSKKFVEQLSYHMKCDDAAKSKALYRLIGYNYFTPAQGISVELDLNELAAAMLVFASLRSSALYTLPLVAFDESLALEVLSVYEHVIDELAPWASEAISKLARGEAVELGKVIERPELLVEVARQAGLASPKKPLVFVKDGVLVTTASELLRAGALPEEVYAHCDQAQICRVREDGSIVKS